MTISVVIPVYNEADMIGPCLESLQRQTRQADEIIIVDNNSTDNTLAIADHYNVIIVKESHQGIAAASRTGMNRASGSLIARCDADSRLPDDWLANIETLFQNNPHAVAVTGPGAFYDTNVMFAGIARILYMYAYFVLVGSAMARWPLFGSNYAIRRTAWQLISDDVHYDRTDIHDDIDVTMHLPLDAPVIFSNRLKVGISARALQINSLTLRCSRGIRSLTLHWPDRSPLNCWRFKLFGRN